MTATLDAPGVQATNRPVPAGRGRWRLALYQRTFTTNAPVIIAELDDARGQALTQQLNGPASFTFTMDGRDPAAALVTELETDVVAYRWSEAAGKDVPYFRGIVGQSEDQLGDDHVVTFTAHDYLAMLARRFVTSTLTYAATDQDDIANSLLNRAGFVTSTPGTTSFLPGSYLPMAMMSVNPDGSQRTGKSGQVRDRTYAGSQQIGTALDDLAHVINGFDYDVVPGQRPTVSPNPNFDWLRVFYPQQGIARTEPLEYGSSIATVTRSVTSADYANFERVLGNNASSDPAAAQLYSEKWNTDANNVGVTPVGLWMDAENAADVSVGTTLDQQASGWLNENGVLIPSYTLGLRPHAYRDGSINMGDTVPVVIASGRLDVTTSLRVVGITFKIGDDGEEDVELAVGRPLTTLVDMLAGTAADVDALARR